VSPHLPASTSCYALTCKTAHPQAVMPSIPHTSMPHLHTVCTLPCLRYAYIHTVLYVPARVYGFHTFIPQSLLLARGHTHLHASIASIACCIPACILPYLPCLDAHMPTLRNTHLHVKRPCLPLGIRAFILHLPYSDGDMLTRSRTRLHASHLHAYCPHVDILLHASRHSYLDA
jgi:hypothetical protein